MENHFHSRSVSESWNWLFVVTDHVTSQDNYLSLMDVSVKYWLDLRRLDPSFRVPSVSQSLEIIHLSPSLTSIHKTCIINILRCIHFHLLFKPLSSYLLFSFLTVSLPATWYGEAKQSLNCTWIGATFVNTIE